MQPVLTEHARFLQSVGARVMISVLVGVLTLSLLGCERPPTANGEPLFAPSAPPSPPPPAERDSALAVLSRMKRSVFDSAFVHLDGYGFVREVRTERLTPSGEVTAWRTRTLQYSPDGAPPRVLRSDSTGSFGDGMLTVLAPSAAPGARPANAAAYAFPDDPAYLSPRTQEAFHFYLRRGPTMGDRATRVVEIRPKRNPDGRDQALRFARLTVARGTNQLLAAHAVRAERVLLFREDSELIVRLQPAPDGRAWVPAESRFRARVDVPLRTPQRFYTESTYSDYVMRDS